jgi:hypothetical protein
MSKTETPSSLPIFEVRGICFRCFVADNGSRYVWRSIENPESVVAQTGKDALAVGRIGGKTWARSGGQLIGSDFATLRDAMLAAIANDQARRRAA